MDFIERQKLLQLLHAGPVVIYTCRASGDYAVTGISENVSNQLGYEPREFLENSRFWSDHIHPDDRKDVLAGRDRVFELGRHTHEYRFLHRDGAYRWMYDQLRLSRDRQGNAVEIVGYWMDVTDLIPRMEGLPETQQVLDSTPDAMIIVNDKGDIVFVNSQAEKVFGYARDELLEKPVELLIPKHVHSRHSRHRETFFSDPHARPMGAELELYGRRKDGSQFPVEISLSPFRTRRSSRVLAAAAVRDITGRKRADQERLRLETKVQQAQKLESLSVLAGGVAHDFNSLLMVVLSSSEIALMALPEKSLARGQLEHINTAALRAAELTKQMLAYAGKGKFVVEALNLSSLLKEMVDLLRASISKKVVLKCTLAGGLPTIEGDATQIRQVIMNLIINASEAMEGKSGGVTVSTSVMEASHSDLSEAFLAEDLQAGRYACLEVSDTDCGMDEQTRQRIFDPFFTTKFNGRGLGLAAVLGIVRRHGGALKLSSQPNRGSTMQVFFPVSQLAVEQPTADTSEMDLDWRGRGVVLVVDDEESVRIVAKVALEKRGYTVLTIDNGREAVEIFRSRADEIVLVVLDLMMPDLDGEETFEQLRAMRPEVRVIVSSGYDEQEVRRRFAGQGGAAAFLQKPYPILLLVKTVRRVLEAPPKAAGASAK